MRALYDNKFLGATISANSENPNYLAENMQDTVLSKVYRSLLDTTIIKISTTITASYVAILGHNFTETVSITLEGNDADAWGAPTFSETVDYRSDICILKFNEAAYAYWRLVITDDESGADGYIEIGSIFLGTYLQLPGMKLSQTLEEVSLSKISISYSGQSYGEERYLYKNPNVSFPLVSHTLRDSMNVMWRNNQNIKPLILLIWADRFDIEPPIYTVMDQKKLSFKRNPKDAITPWGTKIKFREVS